MFKIHLSSSYRWMFPAWYICCERSPPVEYKLMPISSFPTHQISLVGMKPVGKKGLILANNQSRGIPLPTIILGEYNWTRKTPSVPSIASNEDRFLKNVDMLSVLKEKTLEVTLEQCRGTFYFFDLRFDLRFFFFLRNGNLFIYFFWLHWVFVAAYGLSLVVASRGCSSLWCTGFSLRWLLLLQSQGSRCVGFSSCGPRAQ